MELCIGNPASSAGSFISLSCGARHPTQHVSGRQSLRSVGPADVAKRQCRGVVATIASPTISSWPFAVTAALVPGLRIGRSRRRRRKSKAFRGLGFGEMQGRGGYVPSRGCALARRAAVLTQADELSLRDIQEELLPVLASYLPAGCLQAIFAAVRHRWMELPESERPLLPLALAHLIALRARPSDLVAAALSAGGDCPPSFGEGASLSREQVKAAFGEKVMWLLIEVKQLAAVERTVLAAVSSAPLPNKLGLTQGHADLGLRLLTGQETQSRSSESLIIFLAHSAARVRHTANMLYGGGWQRSGASGSDAADVVTPAMPAASSEQSSSSSASIGLPERLLAGVAVDVLAPLANLMGLGRLKDDLEDAAFALRAPEERAQIRAQLSAAATKEQLKAAAEEFRAVLEKECVCTITPSGTSVPAQLAVSMSCRRSDSFMGTRSLEGLTSLRLAARVKTAYSIWKKMKKKGVDFDKVYDRAAMRVIVDSETVAEAEQVCFAVRRLVAEMWEIDTSREKDYISTPKANGYKSIHMQLSKAGGRHGPVELQIRSEEMHRQAEYGKCGHWEYKAGEGVAASDAAQAVGAELFAGMDIDGDGRLNAEELQQALARVGVTATTEDAEAMLQVFDTDHDGAVSFEEFWRALVTTWFPLVSGTHTPHVSSRK